MQDWAYLVANVYAITIEMDNVKFSNKVQQLWDQHHDSMFELIKANLCQGVTVQVNTQSTGGQGKPHRRLLLLELFRRCD